MPKPKKNESEKKYVKRCIPQVIKEGTAKKPSQAAAVCHSMYDRSKKKKK